MVPMVILDIIEPNMDKSSTWSAASFTVGILIIAVQYMKHHMSGQECRLRRYTVSSYCVGFAVILFVITYFARETIDTYQAINPDIIESLVQSLSVESSTLFEFVINLLMLAPFGFLLAAITEWSPPRIALSALILSVSIELAEFACGRGFFEAMDIIEHTVGGLFGCCTFELLHSIGFLSSSYEGFLDSLIEYLIPLYIATKPLYVFPSGSIQPADALLIFGTLLMLPSVKSSGIWIKRRIRQGVLLFVGLCVYQGIVNAIWSVRLGVTIIRPTLYYIFNCIAFIDMLVVLEKLGAKRTKRLLGYGCVASMCVVMIGEVLIGGNLASTSFFNNPNQLGYHCLVIMSIIVWIQECIHPALFVVVSVAASIEIVLSASRAAFLAWSVFIVLFAFYRVRLSKKSVLVFVTAMACVGTLLYVVLISDIGFVASSSQIQNLRAQLSGTHISYDSLLGSGRGYNRIFQLGKNILWGLGEGAFWRFESLYGLELHSTYASLLVSYGIIGFLGYAYLFFKCINVGCFNVKKGLISLSGVLLYQFVHNGIRNTIMWMLLSAMFSETDSVYSSMINLNCKRTSLYNC